MIIFSIVILHRLGARWLGGTAAEVGGGQAGGPSAARSIQGVLSRGRAATLFQDVFGFLCFLLGLIIFTAHLGSPHLSLPLTFENSPVSCPHKLGELRDDDILLCSSLVRSALTSIYYIPTAFLALGVRYQLHGPG